MADVTADDGDRTVLLAGSVAMPLLGFGTWQVRGRRGYEAICQAMDVGYRHIDTATMYGNEAEVGRAVRDSGIARRDVFITTKLPPERAGRERETIAASLRALDMDYVDLWLVHWPPRGQARPDTWSRLIEARDDGLARAIGVSNFSTAQLDELIAATGEAPAVNQIRWSPIRYDAKLLAAHRERGVVVEGYSPLKDVDLSSPVLAQIAAAHDVTPAQVVLRWHIEHRIVVIPKSVTPQRIRSNFDVFRFSLSDFEVAQIDAMSIRR
jgi:2,5-diketo-D-gluconate reductase A